MKLSVSRWAAAFAAVVLLVLPGASRAANHAVRPATPAFDVFDSDPWRPDVYPPERAAMSPVVQSVPLADEGHVVRQPAAKNERWLRMLLRFFLGWWTGGAR